jgi:asparagine synthase (glutamine-hydrolysing)
MRVGFTVVQQGDQARFEHSPPQGRGRPDLVSFARTGSAAAALMGRLYYRRERLAELRPHLPVDLLRECAASEAALALSLYREFGPEGLERLEGDFALVLWDAGALRLLGMRDQYCSARVLL